MDYWDVEHTVLRRCKQDLQRETENRRLVRVLRESRKGRKSCGRSSSATVNSIDPGRIMDQAAGGLF